MKVVIIKYNAGNIRSVLFALDRLGIDAAVTDVAAEIRGADKVIFPGVGEAGNAMRYLEERKLDKVILSLKQPVLGICLGMQLLCNHSEESNTKCLGVFDQQVKKFAGSRKVPQIGWNEICDLKSPLFAGVKEQAHMYFVHSYYVELGIDTIGTSDYESQYSAAIWKNNFFATQFHPEKSGTAGAKILENFIAL